MRKYYQLNRNHKYQIARFQQQGKTPSEIAHVIGVHRSTIYREIKRNKTKKGIYTGLEAWRKTKSRRGREPSGYKIRGWVEERILDGLAMRWSPGIICKRLKLDTNFSISHEAIYKYILKNRYYGGKLYKYLHRQGRKKQKRFNRKKRFLAEPRKSIDSRPVEASNRSEVGHWERDLMLGAYRKGALLVLRDRASRKTLIVKVNSTTARESLNATHKIFSNNKNLPVFSITNDNGVEFSYHKELEKKLKTDVFFADPYSSWQRGAVENVIGFIRKFIPKGTNLDTISNEDLRWLENYLNNKPLKVLGYWTPNEYIAKKKKRLFTKKRHYRYEIGIQRNLFGQIVALSG